MSETKPTAGALRAASLIMGDDEYIFTSHGRKRLEGLVDLIDRESGLRELVKAAELALEWIDHPDHVIDFISAALARVRERSPKGTTA